MNDPRFPFQKDDEPVREDLARLTPEAATSTQKWLSSLERDGIPSSQLERCRSEQPDGTNLPKLLKMYRNDHRLILAPSTSSLQPHVWLGYVAYGRGHQPLGSRARNVYEIAHHRVWGSWPRRA